MYNAYHNVAHVNYREQFPFVYIYTIKKFPIFCDK